MDGGAWWATAHGVTQSPTGLNDFTFTFRHEIVKTELFLAPSLSVPPHPPPCLHPPIPPSSRQKSYLLYIQTLPHFSFSMDAALSNPPSIPISAFGVTW